VAQIEYLIKNTFVPIDPITPNNHYFQERPNRCTSYEGSAFQEGPNSGEVYEISTFLKV
jgi:hypothetical protein